MPKAKTPHTLTGLAHLLAKHGERALVVNGVDSPSRATANRILIDVRRIKDFSAVTTGSGRKITIGAGALLGDVLRQVKGENGLLKQAISMMANPLVRNRVTVFSALAPDSYYFDLATALVSLRSQVRLQSTKRSQTVSITDFLLAAANGLKPGDFPLAVQFSKLDANWRVGFFRVSSGPGRNTVSASIRTRLRRNVALDPEIIVSSSTVIPVYVPAASLALNRQLLTDRQIKKVAAVAAVEMLEMAGVEEDAYEQALIEVAVARAIHRASDTGSDLDTTAEPTS